MIIAGDIGGTKTNVALFETDGEKLGTTVAQKSFPSGNYDSLETILEEFIDQHHPHSEVTHACFGIAGPVSEGRVETPNLAWKVWDRNLAKTIGVGHVELINDLEATAYGIEGLQPSQLFTLNAGEGAPRDGHRALIAAGTGLGMAGIFWDGQHYRPMASEGGHVDFAARNKIEEDLLNYLQKKIGGRVSYERVLSGPGLFNIYSFLRDTKFADEPEWLALQIEGGDSSATVSRAALEGKSALAVKALDIFVGIYGAMAGNLALLLKPEGGVFIGGGIAPKILPKLNDGIFIDAYRDKGRMSRLAASVPVYVILEDKTAMYGAARCALDNSR